MLSTRHRITKRAPNAPDNPDRDAQRHPPTESSRQWSNIHRHPGVYRGLHDRPTMPPPKALEARGPQHQRSPRRPRYRHRHRGREPGAQPVRDRPPRPGSASSNPQQLRSATDTRPMTGPTTPTRSSPSPPHPVSRPTANAPEHLPNPQDHPPPRPRPTPPTTPTRSSPSPAAPSPRPRPTAPDNPSPILTISPPPITQTKASARARDPPARTSPTGWLRPAGMSPPRGRPGGWTPFVNHPIGHTAPLQHAAAATRPLLPALAAPRSPCPTW